MQSHVNVQDHDMQVPRGRTNKHVMPMSGEVCQRPDPDPTGKSTDEARTTQRTDGGGEGKGATQTHKGG